MARAAQPSINARNLEPPTTKNQKTTRPRLQIPTKYLRSKRSKSKAVLDLQKSEHVQLPNEQTGRGVHAKFLVLRLH